MTLNDNLFYYLLKLFFGAREGFNEILNWSNPYKKSNPIAHPTTFPKHFPNFHFQIFTISNFDFKRQTISISNVDCQTEISIFTFTICIFDVQISRCTPRCECVQFFSITNRRRAHFIPNVFNFSNRQKNPHKCQIFHSSIQHQIDAFRSTIFTATHRSSEPQTEWLQTKSKNQSEEYFHNRLEFHKIKFEKRISQIQIWRGFRPHQIWVN